MQQNILEDKKPKSGIIQEATLLLLSTLTVMAGSTISPAIKSMSIFFAAVPNAEFLSKLCLTIPAIAFVVVAPLIGILIDKFGRKPILISTLILYILAGTSGFYLKNLYVILVGRILLGIAVAGITNTTLTLIADYYEGQKRNRVLGFQVAFSAFGGVIFLLVGGALADIGWNMPFLIYALPILLIPNTIISLPESTKNIDEKITEIKQVIDEKSEIIKNDKPVLGKSIKWIIAICYLLIFINMLIFYTGPTQLPFYIPTISPTVSNFLIGLALSLVNLVAGTIGLFFKQIKKLLNFQPIFIIGFSLLGIGFIILSYASSYTIILIAAIIGGLGFGLVMPNLSLYLINNTAEKSRGRLFSGYNSMLYLGQFISPIIFEPIINVTDMSTMFLIGGIIYLTTILVPIIILITFYLRKKKNEMITTQ
ncbi:MAG TPA: MFS transporter [Candidatus Bathyarchaeia archaeon]|nr:MFS transporter [Candidatus Bathyarchaeia archaeon]